MHACGAFGTGTFRGRVEDFGDVVSCTLACAASTLGMATACAAHIEIGVQPWLKCASLLYIAWSSESLRDAPERGVRTPGNVREAQRAIAEG